MRGQVSLFGSLARPVDGEAVLLDTRCLSTADL